MADSFKKLAQGQPGVAPAALYTAPGGAAVIVKHIRIVNTTNAVRTITLWDGGSADGNLILPTTQLQPSGWAEFDGTLIVNGGESLEAAADAAGSVTVTIYGDEVS